MKKAAKTKFVEPYYAKKTKKGTILKATLANEFLLDKVGVYVIRSKTTNDIKYVGLSTFGGIKVKRAKKEEGEKRGKALKTSEGKTRYEGKRTFYKTLYRHFEEYPGKLTKHPNVIESFGQLRVNFPKRGFMVRVFLMPNNLANTERARRLEKVLIWKFRKTVLNPEIPAKEPNGSKNYLSKLRSDDVAFEQMQILAGILATADDIETPDDYKDFKNNLKKWTEKYFALLVYHGFMRAYEMPTPEKYGVLEKNYADKALPF